MSHCVAELFEPGKTLLSVEFFPPKTDAGGEQIVRTAMALKKRLQPRFVSITYGAGGSTRERTLRYARVLKDECGYVVMPHLTCVGSSREELLEIIRQYREEGFRNIMALRGDPPQDHETFRPHPNGCRYANELVELIRQEAPEICIGVAGYPEKHVEADCADTDLINLKRKVDAGASFITTQLFFDNRRYFEFVKRCRNIGVTIPIVPGVMPVLNLQQIRRFCELSGSHLPSDLVSQLERCGDDDEQMREVGVTWAHRQVRELIQEGAPGIHLYILNRSRSAIGLVDRLQADGLLREAGE